MSRSHLTEIELGTADPSIAAIVALADALGADPSMRLYPNTGPRIRDRIQAAIVEELLRIAHPRWQRFTEVPVYRPARGRVDAVFLDPHAAVVVASEVHSQLRRLEQQLGWARQKAESLPSADFWRHLEVEPSISQGLVLRSTRATRELVNRFAETMRVAFPASAEALHAALTGDAQWPGDGILWARVDDDRVELLERPPRGVMVGR